MSREKAREYSDEADSLWRDGEFVQAGHYYTHAAFEHLGVGTFIHGLTSGKEFNQLLFAATCYRLGGQLTWCRNRCRLGALIAEEIAERQLSGDRPENDYFRSIPGAWYEYVGDFHVVGQLGDGSDAYEQALAIYRETNDPLTDNYEQEHGWLIAYVGRLVDETSHDIEEFRDAKHRSTLTEWLAYKRDHLPELLDKLETKDEWNSDESP